MEGVELGSTSHCREAGNGFIEYERQIVYGNVGDGMGGLYEGVSRQW